MIERRSARALVFDDASQLIAIKRTRPGQIPYWMTPGGGVEPDDPSREAAAQREAGEELGIVVRVGPQVFLRSVPWRDTSIQVEHYFLSRLIDIDERLRTGPEFSDPGRGTYELARIPLASLPELDFRPIELRSFILENTTALLSDLP
jgi:8-oxo-dGTP pyrophosphatase MutT (NUDIX family)